jgi:hypothetical protein
MNDELYEMMLSLCPENWKFFKVKGSSAQSYLDFIFSYNFETKWVLNLDEDCFLINKESVSKLIGFMEDNNYDYCGVQDGGSIPVRIHNPLVSNPFFNLFNVEKINKLQRDYYSKKYDVNVIKSKYSSLVRFKHIKYDYDMYEPFYIHFFWLLENGLTPYFLEAQEFSREKYFVFAPVLRIVPYFNSPTMIYDHEGMEIALHTWHSRFINYPNIRKRIMNCYNYARNSSNITSKNVIIINDTLKG